jgi:hypothetical protein
MKKIGYILLQIGGYLILLGGITDFAMTFSQTLCQPHLKYLKIENEAAPFELKNLDYAFCEQSEVVSLELALARLQLFIIA